MQTGLRHPAASAPGRSWLRRAGAALLPTILGLSGFLRAGTPFRVLWADRPPYMSASRGKVTGLTADVAASAFAKAGFTVQWVEIPSARQLVMIRDAREPMAALGWYRNPERERFAKFSVPVYQDRRIAVLSRRDNVRVQGAGTLEHLLSDPGLVLLAKVGYSYGAFLDEKIQRLSPATYFVTVENLSQIRMVEAGRANYMFIAPEEAQVAIRLSGVPVSDLALLEMPDMPPGEKRYLMFSQATDDETIRRINRGIEDYLAAQHRTIAP